MRKYSEKDNRERSRRELLPGGSLPDAFFDVTIQKILCKWRGLPDFGPEQPTKREISEWKALPILMFMRLSNMAQAPNDTSNNELFAHYYNTDRSMAAELLLALTEYYAEPECKWSLARLVSHSHRIVDGRACSQPSFIGVGQASKGLFSSADLPLARLGQLQEMLKMIYEELATVGDKRKRTIPTIPALKTCLAKERKRRVKLLDGWKDNLAAAREVLSSRFDIKEDSIVWWASRKWLG